MASFSGCCFCLEKELFATNDWPKETSLYLLIISSIFWQFLSTRSSTELAWVDVLVFFFHESCLILIWMHECEKSVLCNFFIFFQCEARSITNAFSNFPQTDFIDKNVASEECFHGQGFKIRSSPKMAKWIFWQYVIGGSLCIFCSKR